MADNLSADEVLKVIKRELALISQKACASHRCAHLHKGTPSVLVPAPSTLFPTLSLHEDEALRQPKPYLALWPYPASLSCS
eukprot:scaffold308496_cov15-Tisochrysis_lutea.AAC.1